ncbi:hypothetical protein CAPTEDRAFT_145014 [Capitella teleta]|uniref:Ras-associating domain-containing protein n=1 Tax=Capitella teleta TaxID=283909 RepID=R7TZY7_CAPTE|nr:hypothetical protein CAPTEDRAFT_145014 [Capitella teleta]|eukprot:ELT96971.1 hypothetical protein CAPTEDRAFT_145014 [Capitella teleta]
MASHSKEEREKLAKQIHDWNASRLDLFHLSDPNENLDFFGVMRFYFQGDGEKVSTKCIRVASTANTTDIINTLVEKFRPDMRMLSLPSYALYEVHVTREERRLSIDEYPLVLQLNWGNDLREGRFLLKGEHQKTIPSNLQSDPPVEGNFKRKLSKREKKEQKKKEKEAKLKGKENQPDSVADQLYNELPETSFTRSISNPEAVMRRRRQMKLEKKLEQFKSKDGGPDTGGTLKIYGQSIKPDVPYKTLLLSMYDTAEHVVKETLIKYGLDQEDPDNFCLSQVS